MHNDYTPLETFYVAPKARGLGNGSTPQNAMAFERAARTAASGDEYILLDGTYGAKMTQIIFSGRGKPAKGRPIVWRAANTHKAVLLCDTPISVGSGQTFIGFVIKPTRWKRFKFWLSSRFKKHSSFGERRRIGRFFI